MSASFSLASADVRMLNAQGDEHMVLEGVQITVRSGRAVLTTDRGGAIEDGQREGVVLSRRINRLEWSVTFADHTVWEVKRSKKGCRSCG